MQAFVSFQLASELLTEALGKPRVIPIISRRFPSIYNQLSPSSSSAPPRFTFTGRFTLADDRRSTRYFPSKATFIRLHRNRLILHKKYIKNNYAHDYGYVIRGTVPCTNTASDCENRTDFRPSRKKKKKKRKEAFHPPLNNYPRSS